MICYPMAPRKGESSYSGSICQPSPTRRRHARRGWRAAGCGLDPLARARRRPCVGPLDIPVNATRGLRQRNRSISSWSATIWLPRVDEGTMMSVFTPAAYQASTPSRTSVGLP